jgi:hypothetical protein
MALNAGSVSIASDGTASGTGLAREIYDDYLPKVAGVPAGAQGAAAKHQLADLCNSFASKTIAHIVANAEVTTTIAAGDAALQRTPNPNNANTDTQGPSGTKTLANKGSVA